MPNHIHMIIVISGAERINPFPTTKIIKYDIPNIVGKFKVGVTRIAGGCKKTQNENEGMFKKTDSECSNRGVLGLEKSQKPCPTPYGGTARARFGHNIKHKILEICENTNFYTFKWLSFVEKKLFN